MRKIKRIFDIETEEEYLKANGKININELGYDGNNALYPASYERANG